MVFDVEVIFEIVRIGKHSRPLVSLLKIPTIVSRKSYTFTIENKRIMKIKLNETNFMKIIIEVKICHILNLILIIDCERAN